MQPFAVRGIALVALLQVAALTALSGRYGFHRDELNFLAAGERLDWGYVDQPPLTPLLARMFDIADGPWALRIAATLIGVGITILIAMTARELGAGARAQVLAAAAAALSIFVLVVSHMLSTTSVDTLMWVAVGFLLIRLLRTGDGRWWPAIGAVTGLALTNKWLIPLLVVAVVVSLLTVGPRQVLRTWWVAAGLVVAVLVAAPVVIWQAAHDFPLLTVAKGISGTDGAENRVLFVPLQLFYLSPVLVPVLAAGYLALWRDRRYRAMALSYPVLCVLTVILGGKPYYTMPLLLVLLAAGAEPAWRWASRHRVIASGAVVVGASVSIVLALPVLSVGALAPVLAVNKEQGEQIGWRDFVASVALAHRQADPGSQIFTRNYGQAGAIERYGPEFGLPQPFSGHMSYADWGPPPDPDIARVVVVGRPPAIFTGCRVIVTHRSAIDNDEDGTQIAVCDPVMWSAAWPRLRHYYD